MPHKDPVRRRTYQRAYQNTYQWVRKLARHGLTPQDYEDLLAAQGGGCAICGTTVNRYGDTERRLPVDHDHETGQVRGVLCDVCNRVLGLFGDDPARLEHAAEYLRASRR